MTRGLLRISSGLALGDLLAAVEHGDALGDPHDDAHVVLDEQDRDLAARRAPGGRTRRTAPTPAGSCRPSARRAAAPWAAAPAPGRPRAGAGRRRRGCARTRRPTSPMPDEVEQLAAPSRGPPAPPAAARAGEKIVRDEPGLDVGVHGDHDVLGRRHQAEEPDVLEGPAEALRRRSCAASSPVMSSPPSSTQPAGRLVEPGQHVEERRLAGAVGPDEADDRRPRGW